MSTAKAYRLALQDAQRRYPYATQGELDDEVSDIIAGWCLDAWAAREETDDTDCIENGRDNCDNWGTGEGRYHGRL